MSIAKIAKTAKTTTIENVFNQNLLLCHLGLYLNINDFFHFCCTSKYYYKKWTDIIPLIMRCKYIHNIKQPSDVYHLMKLLNWNRIITFYWGDLEYQNSDIGLAFQQMYCGLCESFRKKDCECEDEDDDDDEEDDDDCNNLNSKDIESTCYTLIFNEFNQIEFDEILMDNYDKKIYPDRIVIEFLGNIDKILEYFPELIQHRTSNTSNNSNTSNTSNAFTFKLDLQGLTPLDNMFTLFQFETPLIITGVIENLLDTSENINIKFIY